MDKKRRKKIVWVIVIIAALISLFFIAKLYLTANLLLGNDIVIKLSSDKENLFLQQGQSEKVKFEGYVLTNPFCTATCSLEFRDLSRNQVIGTESLELKPTIKESREYIINATETGSGQELYRFSMECKSTKTFLCQTNEIPRAKNILITLNYNLTDTEQRLKQDSKERLITLMQRLEYLELDLANINAVITNLDKTVVEDSLVEESEGIHNGTLELNKTGYEMKSLWENESYTFSGELNKAEENLSELISRFEGANETLMEDIDSYNTFIENLTIMRQNLTYLAQVNTSNTTVIDIDNAILHFNSVLDTFSQRDTLANKRALIKKISKEINTVLSTVKADTGIPCCFANETIGEVNISRIELNATDYSAVNISIKEPTSRCCLFGSCEECCNETCSSENFPIILLHGHDFNRKASAEYSLYDFQMIQNALENDGYLNAGSLIITPVENMSQGVWGRMNDSVTIAASYYFDIYQNTEGNEIIQTKTDSLDTYAIRLKDIVDIVKYRTGKDKVIIVAHSMGGLVARRYVQVFGANDVDRMILIATPNKGIDGNALDICPIFGAGLECRDVGKDSLFLNKLNYGEMPSVPIYNIIGIGCSMDNETGDGIVKNSSAYLEGAKNYYVNGTCKELQFEYLHLDLLDPIKYPEVYKTILEVLRK